MKLRTAAALVAVLVSTSALAGPTASTVYSDVRQDLASSGALINAYIVTLDINAQDWPSFETLTSYRVYVNPDTQSNNKLLVFLPGCNEEPSGFTQFLMRAAHHGSRAIGLMYWNDCADSDAKSRCPVDYSWLTTPTSDQCFTNLRNWQYNGQGPGIASDFYTNPYSSVWSLQPGDTVRNRLRKLLRYLDKNFPNQGWAQFAADGHGGFDTSPFINWNLITLAGHSEGTKVGAFIAAHEVLAKALFFSGPSEHVNPTPNLPPFYPWTAPSGFAPNDNHFTPPTKIYDFWSEHDDNATDDNGGVPDNDAANDVVACIDRWIGLFDSPNQAAPFPVDIMFQTNYVNTISPGNGSGYHSLYSTYLASTPAGCAGHLSTVGDCGQSASSLWYQQIWDYFLTD